jgi:hypothetical protein
MSSVAVMTFGKRLVERFMKQTVLQITVHCCRMPEFEREKAGVF